ncbi:MAG TPA: hypothetical protein VFU47_02205, partial [Armatimonadota bacterium]|nr:hypothetical protein [Armatimonadota bacterium]
MIPEIPESARLTVFHAGGGERKVGACSACGAEVVIGDPCACWVPRSLARGRNGDWMQTFTGSRFYPFDPRVSEVRIEDIAHALANLCRFGG